MNIELFSKDINSLHKKKSCTLEGILDQRERQKQLDLDMKGKKLSILNSFILRNKHELNSTNP